MKKFDLSIVIPVFNHEQYLEDLLNSIKTDLNIEIIIVDDCSPNENNIDLNELIKKHNDFDIKLIKNEENLGLFSARRVGVNNSSSDIVFHMDADDTVQDHLLDNLLYQMNYYEADMCKCPIKQDEMPRFIVEPCESSAQVISNLEANHLLKHGKFSRYICGSLIKKDLMFKVYSLFKEYFYLTFDEDLFYNMMILKFGCKITWINDKYYYKRAESGITRKRFTDKNNIYVKRQMSVNIMEILKRYNLLNF